MVSSQVKLNVKKRRSATLVLANNWSHSKSGRNGQRLSPLLTSWSINLDSKLMILKYIVITIPLLAHTFRKKKRHELNCSSLKEGNLVYFVWGDEKHLFNDAGQPTSVVDPKRSEHERTRRQLTLGQLEGRRDEREQSYAENTKMKLSAVWMVRGLRIGEVWVPVGIVRLENCSNLQGDFESSFREERQDKLVSDAAYHNTNIE